MGRPISYFANYHSEENIVTNYCGLMLKMIYDDSPSAFENIITSIIADSGKTIELGAKFSQQEKFQKSIPDICIRQSSFNIFFENKRSDWFYSEQLERHINGFNENSSLNVLILLCSEFKQDVVFEQARRTAETKNIHIATITYEDFLTLIEENATSEFIREQLTEFRNFLDKNELLPTWKYLLDVVNCAGRPQEIMNDNVYMCPDTGKTYSHRRALYFGAYKDKKVHHLYTIEAVVSVQEQLGGVEIKWNNFSSDDTELKAKAINMVEKYRKQENLTKPIQVFILSNAREVDFNKDSKGGMFGTKVYFEGIAKGCQDIDALVEKINNKFWSSFKA